MVGSDSSSGFGDGSVKWDGTGHGTDSLNAVVRRA